MSGIFTNTRVQNGLIQPAKESLVQILRIGAVVYGADALYGTRVEDLSDRTILVDSNRIETFFSEWERRWWHKPDGFTFDLAGKAKSQTSIPQHL